MHTTAVRARGITKVFGDVVALNGVDLDVPAGQIHGLIGPNGAGKTTLLGLLLGLATADAGRLELLGTPVGDRAAVPGGVSGFVDGPGLYPSLTARQNLQALERLRDRAAGGSVHVGELLERVGLGEVADDPVRGFSLGMRQRLGLAAALLGGPRLVVLDEPGNGLDPAGKRQIHCVLSELADAGTTVFLSSHRMDDLADLCAEVSLLSAGRVVFSGPVAKLAADSGDLYYRLVTSDPAAARHVAARTPGAREVVGRRSTAQVGEGALVVRGSQGALDELVVRLVGAGVAIRALGPVVAPLEAAFLALTGSESDPCATSIDPTR